jgi:CBS domain containing-hemolysin-like protein
MAIGLAVLTCFFSLNGYALREVSRHELEAAFAARASRRLKNLLSHLSELQMLCALLRSMANLGLLLTFWFAFDTGPHDTRGILGSLILTCAVIAVFGVAIPHSWSRHAGPKILVATAQLLLILRWALLPVVTLMRAFDPLVRRMTGVDESAPPAPGGGRAASGRIEDQARQDILQVAAEGQAEGAVNREQVKMIESVIRFTDKRASEVMTPRTDMVALPSDAPVEIVRQTIIDVGHSRIPLYDGDTDNIVGIIHAKDLIPLRDTDQPDLRRIMRKPFFVPETKPLDDLLRELKAGKLHMAIVLDEYGGTAGLVTIEDVLEEIVGEIADEYDRPGTALFKRIDERTVEAEGRLRVSRLNRVLGLVLPEDEDYDTVAGFLFSELGYVPTVGETLASHGAEFTVLAADARKITRIRVQKNPPVE